MDDNEQGSTRYYNNTISILNNFELIDFRKIMSINRVYILFQLFLNKSIINTNNFFSAYHD